MQETGQEGPLKKPSPSRLPPDEMSGPEQRPSGCGRGPTSMPRPDAFRPAGRLYSCLRVSAGLAAAAFTVWARNVIAPSEIVMNPVKMNVSQPTCVL